MIFIQVVPDQVYMIWQLYVQMKNFRIHGIEEFAVIVVALNGTKQPTREMIEFQRWTKARVVFYEDTRKSRHYMPSIRPHLLAKYLKENPYPGALFYHDQDIIFIRKPDLAELMKGNVHYVSPGAQNYLWTPYLKKFKAYIFPTMCEIVGISPAKVMANDPNCGGAQYVLKNITYEFWEKVEQDCEALYIYMTDAVFTGIRKYKPTENLPEENKAIQKWCADMWAVLWNLLLIGEVKHNDTIDFSWPWEPLEQAKPIFHNAGVTASNSDKYFMKGSFYSTMPFGQKFDYVDKNCVQRQYVDLIESFPQI